MKFCVHSFTVQRKYDKIKFQQQRDKRCERMFLTPLTTDCLEMRINMGIINVRTPGILNLIKRAHGLVENTDIEKHRQSQDYLGSLMTNKKEVTVAPVDINGMYGEWIRANRVHSKKNVILYCHGGGYSTGSSLYARSITTKLATSTSLDVFSFDYRLAPEHPYPAALEDAMKAWNFLLLLGYGAREIIVAGDSAGGNLALALTQQLKQESRILPRGIILMSPWTDLMSTGKSHQTRADMDPVLNAAYLEQMIQNYAKDCDLEDPLISPLYGELKGFPPTYIQVGDSEILLNDATMLHKKMVKENVPVKIEIFKGMWHVFQIAPFKGAYEAIEKISSFVFEILR